MRMERKRERKVQDPVDVSFSLTPFNTLELAEL